MARKRKKKRQTMFLSCRVIVMIMGIFFPLFSMFSGDSTQAAGEIFYVRAHTQTPIYTCANQQNPIAIKYLNKIFFDPAYKNTVLRAIDTLQIADNDWYLLYPEYYRNLCVPADHFVRLSQNDFQAIHPKVESSKKWIDINLSIQVLTAYEDDRIVLQIPISAGALSGWTTVGEFSICQKWPSREMRNLQLNYDTLGVSWTMYFDCNYKGLAIHCANWQDTDGLPYGVGRSHGCVRGTCEPIIPVNEDKDFLDLLSFGLLRQIKPPQTISPIEWLYRWTTPFDNGTNIFVRPTKDDPGTRVVVHY